ncbi:RNA polymerase sigma-70 factor [Belliella marina]|uniref:RNA polymerase sigma-70 factor n=1 Tax=Belliella marina TaxID=1644146 RepID=A0ABW4VRL4_9BACT
MEINQIGNIIPSDQKGFKVLFDSYYFELVIFANRDLKDVELARELVQDVFVALWEHKESLVISISLKAYLFTTVKNKCLNHLKKSAKITMLRKDDLEVGAERNILSEMISNEYQAALAREIDALPDKCRQIFLLKRVHGKSYKAIAEKMNINEKTVENQMGIALKRLRQLAKELIK